jgi:crotonobetainyl-CoA:carnitine CoA-transferase CaiB-like acyl-CoA transferase
LRPIIATRTTAEWLAYCKTHSIPVGLVLELEEVVAQMPVAHHPQAGAYRLLRSPVIYDGTPAGLRRPAPTTGQHTAEVLREVGYSDREVRDLAETGVVRLAPEP